MGRSGGCGSHRDLSLVGIEPPWFNGANRRQQEWPDETGRRILGATNRALDAGNSNNRFRAWQLARKSLALIKPEFRIGKVIRWRMAPGRGSAETPTRSWVPNYGEAAQPRGSACSGCRHWAFRHGRPTAAGPRLHCLGRESGQETVSPTFGRGSANEAGLAVVVVHPSASQSNHHFPNLLFCSAVAPADWPGDARRDPGKSPLGSEIKIHYECGSCLPNS